MKINSLNNLQRLMIIMCMASENEIRNHINNIIMHLTGKSSGLNQSSGCVKPKTMK